MRFVLVDRLLALEPGHRATGCVVFPRTLEIFADHFPWGPIVPGTLLTEAMAQTGGWLVLSTLHFNRRLLLTTVDGAKFFRAALPDEEILLEAVIRSARPHDFEIQAEARIEGRRVASARLLYHAEPLPPAGPETIAFHTWTRRTFLQLGGDKLLEDARAATPATET